MAVGLIRDPHHAEAILANGEADMITTGCGTLNDPRWLWHAIEELGAAIPGPPQYRAMTRTGVPAHDTIQKVP